MNNLRRHFAGVLVVMGSAGWLSCEGGGSEHAQSDVGTGQSSDSGADVAPDVGDGPSEALADAGAETEASAQKRCAAEVSVSGRHTCVRSSEGKVWCWGANDFGQLGLPVGDEAVPRPTDSVPLPGPAVSLAAAARNTCAVLQDGDIWCWGDNENLQLGNPEVGEGTPVPVEVVGLPTPAGRAALAWGWDRVPNAEIDRASQSFTCAVLGEGSVWCWGANRRGQIGDGTYHGEPVGLPKRVVELPDDIAQVAAGSLHACARSSGGGVWCWGDNQDGQMGIGKTSEVEPPTEVEVHEVVDIAASDYLTCAVRKDRTVWCWGLVFEQPCSSGPAEVVRQLTPAQVDTVVDATSVADTCALLVNGDVTCWGLNTSGGFGSGSFSNGSPCAFQALLPAAASFLSAKGGSRCATTVSDEVWCWGNNRWGQTGNGEMDLTKPYVPVRIPVQALPWCEKP